MEWIKMLQLKLFAPVPSLPIISKKTSFNGQNIFIKGLFYEKKAF